jgi:two-component system, NarL family, response regulator YdfI
VRRVFLITAPGSTRERWEELLDSAEVSVIGRAEDVEKIDEEFVEEAEAVLVDASREPVEDVVASLQEQRLLRETKVVLLTDHPAASAVNRAVQAGVRGILPSHLEEEQLTAALEAIGKGFVVLPAAEVTATRSGRNVTTAEFVEPIEALTTRERDVLQMLSQGLVNKEIAARLGISEHTVKFHVAAILGKLGAATRTEAVSIALRSGLIFL